MRTNNPYRSMLFVPAGNARALQKTAMLDADAFIFDLEDAVAPADKARARQNVLDVITSGELKTSAFVRLNGLTSGDIADDLRAISAITPTGLVFPKIEKIDDVLQAEAVIEVFPNFARTQIWVMIETPLGVVNAASILSHPRVGGLVFGPNDFCKAMEIEKTPERTGLVSALSSCVIAARAHGKIAIDGVFNKFKDRDGFELECANGRMLGFHGKSLIHPDQIDGANRIFAPSREMIAHAMRVIEAHESADGYVAVLDGEMIEQLHVEQAKSVLARAASCQKE